MKTEEHKKYLVKLKYEVVDLETGKKASFIKKGKYTFTVDDPRTIKKGMAAFRKFPHDEIKNTHSNIFSKLFYSLKGYAGNCNSAYYRMLRT